MCKISFLNFFVKTKKSYTLQFYVQNQARKSYDAGSTEKYKFFFLLKPTSVVHKIILYTTYLKRQPYFD